MELVPFQEQWAGSETKLDLKAWYRRSSAHGGFSLVGPFPLRRHSDWKRKGFDYVNLATVEDLRLVAPYLRATGLDVAEFAKAYDNRGNFKTDDYLKGERVKDTAFTTDLQAKVDKYGLEAVTEMMKLSDPTFLMPETVTAPKAKRTTAGAVN